MGAQDAPVLRLRLMDQGYYFCDKCFACFRSKQSKRFQQHTRLCPNGRCLSETMLKHWADLVSQAGLPLRSELLTDRKYPDIYSFTILLGHAPQVLFALEPLAQAIITRPSQNIMDVKDLTVPMTGSEVQKAVQHARNNRLSKVRELAVDDRFSATPEECARAIREKVLVQGCDLDSWPEPVADGTLDTTPWEPGDVK